MKKTQQQQQQCLITLYYYTAFKNGKLKKNKNPIKLNSQQSDNTF